ncbi:MAG: LPS export ABC transporter permease LptG [Zymomonas mobilis subsp. pomaceae]|uniref:Permease YjgP/YjgQ family protein n=1 Tax=Zymomonas mobilis subsp. pomaceae (strain ATCC 29192 / DSM 22645 / JCM 10191 / CCUG 17912 / NBRC 13757 / NCIMB 11200 / NRRL B-4491 / Barker I) TaxID=579138 RepID=F8ERU6_ZYMMT|nr:LPS export ABC transporter permease LptG [Zymomonas mobilis]AEI38559.1 permease YjgP/YjgQ family protein [Zymomonas mobilis subsp. pomaceae ATCC 29192]MDX5948249.1 LPS export ABC transporter permease LptG [Zymomonas mobilis subsp. pomaceae]GEB89004.1 LPS export ABC transporter permease LptG [Zymomonas mobilis subsp. pomaceae]
MIRRIFASRQIALYLSRLFIVRCFAVLAALILILQTLDMLGESAKILAYKGNGQAEIMHYVALRVPQLIARFLPFAVLLGVLVTLSTLNQNSEIISMKAAGISAHQILMPLVASCLVIACFSFAFNDRIVTRATAALDAWQAVDYGIPPPVATSGVNIWVRDDQKLIHVDNVQGYGDKTRLSGITLYQRDNNALTSMLFADHAVWTGHGWRMSNVKYFDVATDNITAQPDYDLNEDLPPERFTLAEVKAEEVEAIPLFRTIKALDAAGRPTDELKAGLIHRFSGALAVILMPLLGSVAGFGLARSGHLFLRIVIGMSLGFAYFVADNFALAMGNLGTYPPLLASCAPFVLFFLIGEAILVRTEE